MRRSPHTPHHRIGNVSCEVHSDADRCGSSASPDNRGFGIGTHQFDAREHGATIPAISPISAMKLIGSYQSNAQIKAKKNYTK
jgi:hypothetical protein